MVECAEVVVIGGGVIGACVTYSLASEGIDVVLVERGDWASGTSGHCNGGVLTGAEPVSSLSTLSNELYKALAEELDMDFHYHRGGSYRLAENELDWELMTGVVKTQAAHGLPVKMLSRKEILEREPNVAPDIFGAVEYPLDATLNPIKFCWSLIRCASHLGARVHRFAEVNSIRVDSNRRVERVCTCQGDFVTKKVVNAAGCWSLQIGNMVGIDIPITPRRGQIVVTETTKPIVNRKMNEVGGIKTQLQMDVGKDDEERAKLGIGFVCEHTADGNFLLGGSREFAGFDVRTSPEVIRAIVKRAVRFVPKLKQLACIRSYAGIRPFSPDHLPILSKVPEVEGFYIASGHEGDGIALAPLSGRIMSDLVTEKKPIVEVELFSFSRFKKPIKEEHPA